MMLEPFLLKSEEIVSQLPEEELSRDVIVLEDAILPGYSDCCQDHFFDGTEVFFVEVSNFIHDLLIVLQIMQWVTAYLLTTLVRTCLLAASSAFVWFHLEFAHIACIV